MDTVPDAHTLVIHDIAGRERHVIVERAGPGSSKYLSSTEDVASTAPIGHTSRKDAV